MEDTKRRYIDGNQSWRELRQKCLGVVFVVNTSWHDISSSGNRKVHRLWCEKEVNRVLRDFSDIGNLRFEIEVVRNGKNRAIA